MTTPESSPAPDQPSRVRLDLTDLPLDAEAKARVESALKKALEKELARTSSASPKAPDFESGVEQAPVFESGVEQASSFESGVEPSFDS